MDSFIRVSEDNLYIDVDNDNSSAETNIVSFGEFQKKIQSKCLSIAVIGLGYSGLQLSVSLAKSGYSVTGIDFDREKTKKLNSGESYIESVSKDDLKNLLKADKFYAVHDFNVLGEQDVLIISDQMPSYHPKNKDVSFLMVVIENILSSLNKTQLLILDNTMLPGTCTDVIYPLFGEHKKIVNKDFFLAAAPERIDYGNNNVKFNLIPKIVGGVTSESVTLAAMLLRQVFKQVHEVTSTTAAEMVKFIEISYKWVNTAFVNEMMMMSNKIGINIWEVLNAVKSNPFEYFRFMPSTGYGEVSRYNIEPFTLSFKKSLGDIKSEILDKSIEINTYITSKYIVDRISAILNERKKCINGSNILIVGISSMRDAAEWNESSALDIMNTLLDKGANIYYHDPMIPSIEMGKKEFPLTSIELDDETLKWLDMTVILMDHKNIDFEKIINNSSVVLDAKHVTGKFKTANNIHLL